MLLTTLIQNRGCLRYTCTQYTKSSKQRACRTTIFNQTFIVWLFAHKGCCCTTLTTLTHTEGVVHIYVYTVYNKQQTATGNFLAKKGAIRPSARCHFATNYQLLCQYLFLRCNFWYLIFDTISIFNIQCNIYYLIFDIIFNDIIRPKAWCHFATNYQLFCQYIFHPYNISATLSFSRWYWYQYGLVIGFKWI